MYPSMEESRGEHEPSSVCGGENSHERENSEVVKCWQHHDSEQDGAPNKRPISLVERLIQIVRIAEITNVEAINHLGLTAVQNFRRTIQESFELREI